MGMAVSTESINEGDVLWIEPALCRIPQSPDGFAFRVERLLGWSDPGHGVWVRGVVLHSGGTTPFDIHHIRGRLGPRGGPSDRHASAGRRAAATSPSPEGPLSA